MQANIKKTSKANALYNVLKSKFCKWLIIIRLVFYCISFLCSLLLCLFKCFWITSWLNVHLWLLCLLFPFCNSAYNVSFSFLCLFSLTSFLLYLLWSHPSQSGIWFCNFWNKCRCRPCKGETKWYNCRGTQNWGAFLPSCLPLSLILLFWYHISRMMHVSMSMWKKNICLCGVEQYGII